jgi:small subunit ribosomal protein S20
MPIIRSAKKKLRQDKKRTVVNLLVKKQVKFAVKEYRKHPSASLLQKAFSTLDAAAKKNVYHKNKADRLKSRLSKLMSQKSSKTSSKKTA